MDPKHAESVLILRNVLKTHAQRLNHGAKLRGLLADSLNAGTEPTDNYRLEWIRDSVDVVMGALELSARQFNGDHPDDCCSAQDLMDVLTNCIASFKKATST